MRPVAYAREFQEFLFKSNMFAMAIGVVIGQAVGRVVTGIVEGLLMPVVGILQPHGQWREFGPVVGGSTFKIGLVLGTMLDFIIVAAVVFILTKLFVRRQPAPPTKACLKCKEPIHAEAVRCRYCTSEV